MTEWEGRAQKQERHTDIRTLLCLISFDSKGDRGVTSDLKGKDLTKQHDTESHTEPHTAPRCQLGGERILERSHALPASHWHATLTPRDRTRTPSHIPGAPLSPAHTHQASVTENKFLQLPGSCAQAHHARCGARAGTQAAAGRFRSPLLWPRQRRAPKLRKGKGCSPRNQPLPELPS